jgi:hypothetical protein
MLERKLKRHAAYFRGWCQPFGEHESVHREDSGVNWLLAENQVGLVLPRSWIKPLYREVLLRSHAPVVTFSHDDVEIGSLMLPLDGRHGEKALEELSAMLKCGDECHVFLTSHLLYSGRRIITFSGRKPLSIIYKEIGTMRIRVA